MEIDTTSSTELNKAKTEAPLKRVTKVEIMAGGAIDRVRFEYSDGTLKGTYILLILNF